MKQIRICSLLFAGFAFYTEPGFAALSATEAVALALDRDPWFKGSQYRQQALIDEAAVSGTLPDPTLSLMAGNLPVDSFDLGQEPMTQLSIGMSQMFPRGDTLSLAKQKQQQLALQHPLFREDRRAKVKATVLQFWLDAYSAQESIRLIESDRALFEHLVDAAETRYSTAVGHVRQQDVIRAQLELTRLEDRLTVLRQREEAAQQGLWEWVGIQATTQLTPELHSETLSKPVANQSSDQDRFQQIRNHPSLLAFELQVAATETEVEIARQKYQPEWGFNARYGYRAEDPQSGYRADLFSVGVTFDLPLFTANRQDKSVSASSHRAAAIKTDRQLLRRRLVAELEATSRKLVWLSQRQSLYAERLLPQMTDQAQAALAAYNNDNGDFAEAVRARIAKLNATIEALDIAVERQKTIVQINYLLTEATPGAAKALQEF